MSEFPGNPLHGAGFGYPLYVDLVRVKAHTGDRDAAVVFLQEFVDENCARIEEEYKMLNRTLPAILKTVGIEFLFTEYLKNWTSKKGVPLPLE